MKNVKKFIKKSFEDPIMVILLKNSNLTDKQYETFLIDIISDKISDIKLNFKEKAHLRANTVSRGSFSRTLSQARKNVISSIFTILLLSYTGIFQESPFDEYYTLSERLGEYLKIINSLDQIQSRKLLLRIEKELTDGIYQLSKPKALA